MKRFSLKAWGLFIIAISCLSLYLCFAPKTPSTTTTVPPAPLTASVSVSDTEEALLNDLPTPGERVGIRGHGILLRKEAGLSGELIRESEAGESFYTTGKTSLVDELVWIELELSPEQKAWISKGFIQRQRDMPAFTSLPATSPASLTATSSPQTLAVPSPTPEAFENPHLKSVSYWHKYPARVRQDISMKLAMQMLKASKTTYTPDHTIALEACINESSKAPDLQTLKIYELASTCAIAFQWQ